MSDSGEQKLAVLIDADNASKGDLKAILEEIAKYGTPTVKRAYGDWSSPQLAGWKEVLLENGAVPVQQYAYTTGKNATDAAMIIDAMDFLHGQRRAGVRRSSWGLRRCRCRSWKRNSTSSRRAAGRSSAKWSNASASSCSGRARPWS